jgi:hypothetical protein
MAELQVRRLSAMRDNNKAKSFTVRVDDEDWREARSLAQAGPEDKVFVVDSTDTVVFGDGTNGRRPSANAVVTVSYREGGGDAGNAQVAITTRWPPRESRYVIGLAAAGVRISRAGGTVERFAGDKRLRYFDGQLLSAADLQDEQQYLIRMRHRHNQALHGSGIVTGLAVTVSTDASPPSVVVEPGLALDRKGRELELAAPVAVEIRNPDCSQYVIVEYTERETDPVPLPADSTGTTASRVEEGALIRLSAEDISDDGIAIGRLVLHPTGWKMDSAFEPSRCR